MMKSLFLAFSVAVLCCSCEPATPASSEEKKQSAPATQKKNSQSLRQEVQGAVDYGIGAAQLEAKKRAENKIQQINQKHNQDLDEALK